MSYTELSTALQVPVDDPRILSLDEEIVSSMFWRRRAPDPRETIAARNAIIYAYEQGAIGATEAIGYLVEKDLLGDADFFLSAFCEGVRALSSRPPHSPSPLPPAAPGASPGHFTELLEVMAPARERRVG